MKFRETWFADQLTSLGDFLFQLQFVYCIYPSNFLPTVKQFCDQNQSIGIPLLNIYPYYARLLMSLRRYYNTKKIANLVNAFKFFLTIVYIILAFVEKLNIGDTSKNNVRISWVTINAIVSIYKFIWDTYMDWNLWQLPCWHKGVKWLFLRKRMLYNPIWVRV